ncbi:MAG: leucine-rich repeat domain-containing protein, partial [Muribaculaceae bacterium]|nr:leucine-rich repeat domain-containing protein [Muribaculaceae bacterium]
FIGDLAFSIYNLKKSAYPDNLSNPFSTRVTSIKYPQNAFFDDNGVIYSAAKDSIYFAPLSLKGGYSIPNSVQTIGNYAFSGCDGLTSVTIPNSVTTIGEAAFRNCSGLTSVTIPNSVTTIGDNAFSGCSGLTSIVIPNSVQIIGNDAFRGSGSKKSAYPDNLNDPFSYGQHIKYPKNAFFDEKGVIYSAAKDSIYFAPLSLEGEYTLPSSVKAIGRYAFSYCDSLTSVVIGNSVTTIGNSAFSSCTGLTSIDIPNSVQTIGDYAFHVCTGFTSIVIGNSVKTIGESAFSGCSGMTSVKVLWDKPVAINEYVFSTDTYSKATLDIPENTLVDYLATNWKKFSNISVAGAPTKLYSDGVLKYRLIENPDNREAVVVSGNYGSMTEVNIPERFTDDSDAENPVRYIITGIAPDAFKNCTKLKTVNFHSRSVLTAIGNSAFSGCSSLSGIKLPGTVTTIGASAFSSCSKLNSVELSDSLLTIGNYAFNACTALIDIKLPE